MDYRSGWKGSMTTAFITGVSGFVGGHLSKFLFSRSWRVSGQDLRPAPNIQNFYQSDLHDRRALQEAMAETRPDVIFHLAGVIKSDTPDRYYQAHVLGTVALLDTVVASGLSPVVFIASSSAVYGFGLGRRPITEQFKPRPATHYGVSKLAQELAALHYFTSFDLPVILVRTFNLLGPGLSSQLACSAFAKQIAKAERDGVNSTITTGDLSARRDFVDVRDAVRAYVLLAEKGQAGQAYNVASGQAVAIWECLDFLRRQARLPIKAVLDPARLQKIDIPVQVGNAKRLRDQTGWEPEISIEQSLLDLLDDWRQRVKTE
jgi:GDP-4-dehydro-6-deoxy-D-mannose reductase